jgi:hypothetical protein
MQAWWRVLRLGRHDRVHADNFEGNSKAKEAMMALRALEKVDSDSSWWKCCNVITGSFPQLVLQSYVLILARDFYPLAFISIALSLISIAWSNVSLYNRRIGQDWLSVGETRFSTQLCAIFLHFIGSAGLRAASVIIFIVAFSTYGAILVSCFALTNLLSTAIFIFHPTLGNTSAIVYSILAEDQRKYYAGPEANDFLSGPNWYRWYFLIGYAGWNAICAAPGMSRYGWHWHNRWACTISNIAVRFLESWVAVLIVVLVPNASPCDIGSELRFTTCDGCCRGPLVLREYLPLVAGLSFLYVVGFVAWWPHQSKHYSTLEEWRTNTPDSEVSTAIVALLRWNTVRKVTEGP